MEALISNFNTLLTKKDHYVTHLPYMLMCILLHNTAETLWSVVSYANIYNLLEPALHNGSLNNHC